MKGPKSTSQQEASELAEAVAKLLQSGERTAQLMVDQKRFTMMKMIGGALVPVLSGFLEHLFMAPVQDLPPGDPGQPSQVLMALLVPDRET